MDFIFLNRDTKKFQTFTGDKERSELIKKNALDLQTVYPCYEIYYIPRQFLLKKNWDKIGSKIRTPTNQQFENLINLAAKF
jgi:hypothetical protein